MAAPSYTSDLTSNTINDGSGTFTEPAGALLGAITAADTDNFIQGTTCNSKTTGVSGAPALAGLGFQAAGAQTITSPNAYYAWVFVGGGGLIETLANGGIRLIIGQDKDNYRYWYVDGNDYFPYIGWQCIAIETNNAVVAATGSQGTPSTTKQYFGVVFSCKINIGKGNPMAIDAIRWGRTITVTLGDLANGYATFPGIAATNDTNANRWGQFQAIPGGYQLQGKLLLGVTGGDVVDFRDSNRSIAIALSRKTATTFNAIEIQNASSRVDWDACNFTALGTNSRGTVTVTDNADVNITGCSFTGMDTFSFLSATDCLSSTFRGCNAITAAGSNMSGTQVLVPTVTANTSALIWNVATDPDGKLDNMTFSQNTTPVEHHAIEFGTSSPTTMTLRGITFTDFDTANNANGSVLHIKRTSGTVNIYTVDCSGTVSYKAEGTTTVNIIADPVTFLVNVKNTSGDNIFEARVFVKASDDTGPFPFEESVAISNSGLTATVTHAGHGMASNDKVVISGATSPTYDANNGIFSIVWVSDNSYTYTMLSAPGDGAVPGTTISTYVAISGLTDLSGNISMSRVLSASQPIIGWARKHSIPPNYTPPNYRTGPIGGSIDSADGLTSNIQLVSDD